MKPIQVEHQPDDARLERLGVFDWPIWESGIATFPWSYDAEETCYLLEGVVTVIPEGGAPIEIQAGDLVVFPQGMACEWTVTAPVRKHYRFG